MVRSPSCAAGAGALRSFGRLRGVAANLLDFLPGGLLQWLQRRGKRKPTPKPQETHEREPGRGTEEERAQRACRWTPRNFRTKHGCHGNSIWDSRPSPYLSSGAKSAEATAPYRTKSALIPPPPPLRAGPCDWSVLGQFETKKQKKNTVHNGSCFYRRLRHRLHPRGTARVRERNFPSPNVRNYC